MIEHLNPRSRILDEAQERHEVQLNALVDEYHRNGDSENVAHLKVQNALLPLYRKELRKVLLEYLQWMRAMEKDYTFQKVMETQKEFVCKSRVESRVQCVTNGAENSSS